MNIQHLCNILRYKVTEIQQEKRRQRLGISPYAPIHKDIASLIRINVVEPIVRDLCQETGENITVQVGLSTGFYKLLVNKKAFIVIYIPNPASGLIYVRYLNKQGLQCASAKLLNDTSQIVSYLKDFKDM